MYRLGVRKEDDSWIGSKDDKEFALKTLMNEDSAAIVMPHQ